jgi:hypothetical protein
MYGAGHIADMISRMKANKAMLTKSRYFKVKRRFETVLEKYNLNYRETSPKAIAIIKEELRVQKRKEVNCRTDFLLIACLLDMLWAGFVAEHLINSVLCSGFYR